MSASTHARYASVVLVDPSLSHLDRAFTYAVPEGIDVDVGGLVRVPFRGRRRSGVVVATLDRPDVERTLPIADRLGPGLDASTVALARWVADRYLSTLGEALAAALPKRVVSEEADAAVPAEPAAVRDASAFAAYRNGDALLRAVEQGVHRGFVWRPRADATRGEGIAALVSQALARGRGALVLVPEVRVRSEVVAALDASFGDTVAWLGSDRSPRARYRDWLALRAGAKRVAVGGRGSVFAPAPDLGLVVVDDESHASYKEGRAPRFHARTVAAERARVAEAPIVLVGVPPSVEARAAADRGPYLLVAARREDERRTRPPVTVVEREPGERLVPSPRTLGLARRVLAEGRRVVLLTHRGGDALVSVAARATRILEPRRPATLHAEAAPAELASAARSADLLVATPYLAKDLTLDGVGLVAILEPDAALSQTGFRAQEEAFATWWRAARWAAGGAIAVETQDPGHPAIVALTRWDPDVLYRVEAARREELGYPPFAALARVDVPSERAGEVAAAVRDAAPALEVLGPAERDGSAVIVLRAKRRADLLSALGPLASSWREREEPMRVDVDPWEVLVPRWRS